jgi:hypothetical protein
MEHHLRHHRRKVRGVVLKKGRSGCHLICLLFLYRQKLEKRQGQFKAALSSAGRDIFDG